MNRVNSLLLMGMASLMISCAEKEVNLLSFDNYPVYTGNDEGLSYSSESSSFVIWSPIAEEVRIHLYDQGSDSEARETHPLEKTDNGSWRTKIAGDWKGWFYTFQIRYGGIWLEETPGIWAKAVGVNGERAAIIDPEESNPAGWKNDGRPALSSPGDILLYEVHIRDFSLDPQSGSTHPGKYLGMVENGTRNGKGLSTGIDHLKELGVTHVHLLPCFDHWSIDETRLDSAQFNWGYDPKNYNVPEGSFSSDPYDPLVRIREFKEMVMGFHKNGIRVIMDVVYNHTGTTENSNFNLSVPGYYYRHTEDGGWSNASACGNETASERAMMRKFMIESCKYWMEEYHIDGFRFDLMGIHDIETMNVLSKELHDVLPSVFLYGEGWTAGSTPLPDSLLALKKNAWMLDRIAVFSDDLRDGLKGSVFEDLEKGFVSGAQDKEESIKFGIVASVQHPQINYSKVNYSDRPYNTNPYQTISYVTCHDNHTLADKLAISTEGMNSDEELLRMQKLANAIVLTSQGVPFLHAGVELRRSKQGEHNSFNLSDEINQIRWELKTQNQELFNCYQELIRIRKAHPAFRMASMEDIQQNIRFFENSGPQIVAFILDGKAVGDSWSKIQVIHNARMEEVEVELAEGDWKPAFCTEAGFVKTENVFRSRFHSPKLSTCILYQE